MRRTAEGTTTGVVDPSSTTMISASLCPSASRHSAIFWFRLYVGITMLRSIYTPLLSFQLFHELGSPGDLAFNLGIVLVKQVFLRGELQEPIEAIAASPACFQDLL